MYYSLLFLKGQSFVVCLRKLFSALVQCQDSPQEALPGRLKGEFELLT